MRLAMREKVSSPMRWPRFFTLRHPNQYAVLRIRVQLSFNVKQRELWLRCHSGERQNPSLFASQTPGSQLAPG